jgi:protein TonB
MASGTCLKLGLIAPAALVAACASLIPQSPGPAEREARVSDTPAPTCGSDAPSATIDAYKIGVAHHILRSNLGHTYDGQMAPMVPAIVVVRLSVDSFGKLTDVSVQRTLDDTAAQEAAASIRRSGTFPLPCGLIARPDGTLTFYETFLFNGQYQFQLRSLGGAQ